MCTWLTQCSWIAGWQIWYHLAGHYSVAFAAYSTQGSISPSWLCNHIGLIAAAMGLGYYLLRNLQRHRDHHEEHYCGSCSAFGKNMAILPWSVDASTVGHYQWSFYIDSYVHCLLYEFMNWQLDQSAITISSTSGDNPGTVPMNNQQGSGLTIKLS